MPSDRVSDGFNEDLGMRVEFLPDGSAAVSLEVERRHLNYEGTVHGGVLSALADVAMARAIRAVVAPTRMIMTVALNLSFAGAVSSGTLRAVGRSVHSSEAGAFGRVEIKQRDRLVAFGQGVWHVRERSRPRPDGAN